MAEVAAFLAEALDDDFCRARAARCVANMKVLRDKNSEGLSDLSRALALFRNLGAEIEQAATLSCSLQPLIYMGNYAEALERAEEAREIAAKHGDELLLARLEINFGNILHRQDRFREAVKHYQNGLEQLERLEQPRDCAIALANLAVCQISLHDFRRAEEVYKRAREISEREKMLSIVAQADYNIAYLYYYRNEYAKAIELYQKTRFYCQSVNDEYHSALCDLDQAEMYLELHLHEEGVQLAGQAMATFEQLGMSYEATKAIVLLGIGSYQSQRSFPALELFAKAQERMRTEANSSWIATLDLYQALLLQQEGRYYEALRHCRRAQESLGTLPTSLLADTHLLLAGLQLDLGRIAEAESWIETAMDSAHILESPSHLRRAFWLSGQLAEKAHAIPEALSAYRRALEYQEATPLQLQVGGSKIPHSKNHAELYEAIIDLELRAGDPPDVKRIFETVEKSRAREIAELIRFQTNALPAPSRSKSTLVEQVNNLREELNWYYRKVNTNDIRATEPLGLSDDLRSTIRERENSLVSTLGELQSTEREFHSLVSASTVPMDQVREQIAENEVIVEFSIVRGLVCACLLERDGLQVVPLARLTAIRQQLRQLGILFMDAALQSQSGDFVSESQLARTMATLEILDRELIGPIRNQLEGRRLIIVPDGPLHYLPFHALFDGERYLYEKHVISYAGSASAHNLACAKLVSSGERDFIVGESPVPRDSPVSGHTGFDSKFARLPNLQALPSHPSEWRFLHLESTLRLRRDNVLFSSLSVGTSELSILDTFHLRLPCDVLSLAGSGPGIRADDYGRELLSLARGLEYAGARAVLMPLWNAHPEPTQMFLGAFYKRAALHEDRAEVFQITIAEVRRRYTHPFHWAAFTLRGKTRADGQNDLPRRGKISVESVGPHLDGSVGCIPPKSVDAGGQS
ncbi:MAG TPA: CHAT domain-containing protein [Candidatus Saccharimonadales bacterium]|nr:CHAT domain-containing protein [Candidatus Saccharimonadales bacterium]